jgi:predicted dehydrogenase
VRVGVIGRGFGASVVAPAFESVEGCEVVDVVTARDDAAVAALCRREDLDLISVHSPPFMHLAHVRRAIDAGHAVLCDKPLGQDAEDAQSMCELAQEAGVVALVNYDNRYHPVRQRVRELVRTGAIGQPEHLSYVAMLSYSKIPLRPWGWLFDASRGGGWLLALGAHEIDFVRWVFGDVVETSGQLRTEITERPEADGTMRRCTADDGFVVVLRCAGGVTAVIDSTSVAPTDLDHKMVVVGSAGVLEVSQDRQLLLHNLEGTEELFRFELGSNGSFVAQKAWAAVVRDVVREGASRPDAPTFADGLASAKIMDEVRRFDS